MNGDPAKRDVKSHKLFEIATEVANRVGGIYSVLKSKVNRSRVVCSVTVS